jgi:hypothetical protein
MTHIDKALELLNLHHRAFFEAKPFADETQHPNPSELFSAEWVNDKYVQTHFDENILENGLCSKSTPEQEDELQ